MIYDSHTHTICSHDGHSTADEMCREAVLKGYSGITFTDHADAYLSDDLKDFSHIMESVENSRKKHPLEVMSGVEIGDGFECVPFTKKLARMADFDYVLWSCHVFESMQMVTDKYREGQFSYFISAPCEEIRKFLDLYYENLIRSAKEADFDCLAHLTLPFRYIVGGAGRTEFSSADYMDSIEKVLDIAIAREKAIEINTSGYATAWKHFLPEQDTFELYYQKGGRLVTIGTDAHKAENLGKGFKEAQKLLKSIGFTHYNYYKQRKPVNVAL